ncbi:GyrI-like domain-containing protein [Haloimpatiens sp. FM7315]|uniref:GyrI-like domain-containing protein n=1 Tax=Haloimpatiens sp. FM7315 TaxID=3298609 RepID=UPI0035A3141E
MHLTKPTIVKKSAFKIIGMKYFGKNQKDEIKALWNQFYNRKEEIQNKIEGSKYYGICQLFSGSSKFSYIASVIVKNTECIPKEMVSKIIPCSQYAVFSHKGSLNSLGQTYGYIYGVWLPNSGYEHSTLPDIEEYIGEYYNCENHEECIINIYIPIR